MKERKTCIIGGDPGVDQLFVNDERFNRMIYTFPNHQYFSKSKVSVKYITLKEFKDLEHTYKSINSKLNRRTTQIEYLKYLGIREIYKVIKPKPVDMLLIIGRMDKRNSEYVFGNYAVALEIAKKYKIKTVLIDIEKYNIYEYIHYAGVFANPEGKALEHLIDYISKHINTFAVVGESGLNRVKIDYKAAMSRINILFKGEDK